MSKKNSKQGLLIELCTEELPPKSLSQLSESFSNSIVQSLSQHGLIDEGAQTHSFASPRRLAVLVPEVAAAQETITQQRKGPALQAAFNDDGEPSKAALGFAKSCGVEVSDLEKTTTEQGTWLTFEQTIAGKSIAELAQEALDLAIKNLPIAKRMRWGDSSAEFVRPVHKLLTLHGSTVLPLTAFGLTAGNITLGHRYHHPDALTINHVDAYEQTLEQQGKVIADFAKRKTIISDIANKLAKKANATAQLSNDLLDEVTGLVEWPVGVLGEFDESFLAIPQEALIASMKDHQKYFHLHNKKGQLSPHFITISNIKSTHPQRVVAGNERVLKARLSDAMFFWEQDKTSSLASHQDKMQDVLFHVKLGSVAEKVQRIGKIATFIGKKINADLPTIKRAAQLCKNDLVTNMVGEFPALQGTMGCYYALHDEEDTRVADAIEQHYWPKFAGDKLPESPEATAIAMADRLDTLVGIFATGEKPSGVKDPYALRRAALGLIRMLIAGKLDLSLQDLLQTAMASYNSSKNAIVTPDEETQSEINQFILDRLRAYYLAQNFSSNEFNAVAECHPQRAIDFDNRIKAIHTFYNEHEDDAKSLAAANKRIANILRKIDYNLPPFSIKKAQQTAEKHLAAELDKLSKTTQAAFTKNDYAGGLTHLASLRPSVDQFFDEIMVMDEDLEQRNNRLALLQDLRALFMQVADISHLVIEK